MTLEGTGQGELAQLMADHFFGDIHRNVLSTVMDGDGVTNKFRIYRGGSGPSLQNLLLLLLVHGANPCEQLCFHVRSLLATSAH